MNLLSILQSPNKLLNEKIMGNSRQARSRKEVFLFFVFTTNNILIFEGLD